MVRRVVEACRSLARPQDDDVFEDMSAPAPKPAARPPTQMSRTLSGSRAPGAGGHVGIGGVRRPPSSGSLSGAARAPAGAKPAPMKLGGAKKPPSKNDIDLEAMLNG